MTITEKAAYLKGLMEGMNMDASSDNGKMFAALIDTINDMALSVSDLESEMADVYEEIECIEDALDEIDDCLADMDEDMDGVCEVLDEILEDDGFDFDDEDEDDEDFDDEFYQLVCPTCGEEICIDEDILEEGAMKCPACGEDLEFDVSDLFEDECDGECDGCSCDH